MYESVVKAVRRQGFSVRREFTQVPCKNSSYPKHKLALSDLGTKRNIFSSSALDFRALGGHFELLINTRTRDTSLEKEWLR